MRDRLFPFLLLLTLVDLAFVEATGIVSGAGLLPMWLLAGASPWLRRLQRSRVYRMLWNVAVLAVFAALAHHAATTGLLYMLEDGLLLAVLCQVHLLNNVGERQRPDLVFFNSFLVTFVTSFFAADLAWSLLFVLHTCTFVPALQVNTFVRRGSPPTRDVMLAILRDGGHRVLAICAVTAVLFVILPRGFASQGWLGDFIVPRGEAGVSEQIRLDNEAPMRLGKEVVMRLEPASGDASQVPSHWRSIAFTAFNGAAWLPQDAFSDHRFPTDPPWQAAPVGGWQRTAGAEVARVRVRLHDTGGRHLPCPLAAHSVRMIRPEVAFEPRAFGGFSFLLLDAAPGATVEYEVGLTDVVQRAGIAPHVRTRLCDLPVRGLPGIVHDLAARLRVELDASGAESIAVATSEWLQQHRRYQLPGGPGFARNLGEFLIGSGAGHCEYFATSLALLLRLQGIPCRLVGGYLAHEWDPSSRSMLVRARDAHAWVEVLRADGTWLTVDPTPHADVTAGDDGDSWFGGMRSQLAAMWSDVVGFDEEHRAAALRAIAGAPMALVRAVAEHPLWFAAAASPLVLAWLRRRRRQHDPAIVRFDRAVRAAGLSLLPGETPRELLARAAAAGVDAERRRQLEAAAEHHERQRYGRAVTR